MSVARFIADQRTFYLVPHTFTCRVLAVSEAWFYKWRDRPPTPRQARRALLDEAVRKAFAGSKASYGSPRVHADLIDPSLAHPELTAPIATGGEEPLVLMTCREPGADRADKPVEECPPRVRTQMSFLVGQMTRRSHRPQCGRCR